MYIVAVKVGKDVEFFGFKDESEALSCMDEFNGIQGVEAIMSVENVELGEV